METYQTFAENYSETELSIDCIPVLQQLPSTPEIVESLNPDATLKMIGKDLKEFGYVTQFAK